MIDDVDRIMAVMDTAFDPAFGEAWNRRQVEDALKLSHCHYFIASPEGRAVGDDDIAAGFWMSRAGFGEEELLLLAVDPKWRRRGVGRALLEELRNAAREREAERLLLEMREGNPAQTLYDAFGFYMIGRRPDYYRTLEGKRIDALTFACDIA